jgi:feruloyl esterase
MVVRKACVTVVLAGAVLTAISAPARADSCESLTSLSLPNAVVTAAQSVVAGAFTPPKRPSLPIPADYKALPAFCRAAVAVTPVKDSEIKFEIWMPAAGWNGKFVGVGNGGYSGEIWYWAMAEPLARGYATASTDTGHEGGVMDASFAMGHPEKLADFGWRAVHEMTVKSKAITAAFYGRTPRLAYWNGCSTGGRQGLMEAQRFPADYDGIIAGAPANYMTHLSAQTVWVAQAMRKEPGGFIPPDKLPVLHKAVLAACDAQDGVRDGVLEDPTRCRFDPKVVQCQGADGPDCLTAPQVEAVRKIYGGSVNPRTKELLFPGMSPGGELGWATGVGAVTAEPMALATGIFKYVVFKDPNWDYKTYDFDRDSTRADEVDGGTMNAINPNLKAFFDRGGKLLQYHGWADPGIAPLNSINYYNSVGQALGGVNRIQDKYRLFLMPGMNHCRGGDGPDQFDSLGAMEQWVEGQKAPERLIASRSRNGQTDRTRPLCPYPQMAIYSGAGNTDDAANFACKLRAK